MDIVTIRDVRDFNNSSKVLHRSNNFIHDILAVTVGFIHCFI